MTMKNEDTFEFTYSAKQQEEIAAIKKKYMPVEEDKMETLRKLDHSAEQSGTMIGIIIGMIGMLIMGGGMSLCLVWTDQYMFLGIVLGVIGIAIMALAYPLCKRITKKRREKLAPQILELAKELTK